MEGWIIAFYEDEQTNEATPLGIWGIGGRFIEGGSLDQAMFLSPEDATIEEVRILRGQIQNNYPTYDVRSIRVKRSITIS